jgi:hypothetical protein
MRQPSCTAQSFSGHMRILHDILRRRRLRSEYGKLGMAKNTKRIKVLSYKTNKTMVTEMSDDIFEITKENYIISRILRDVFHSVKPTTEETLQLIRILEGKPILEE